MLTCLSAIYTLERFPPTMLKDTRTTVKADYLSRLMNCYVPPDLEILLTNLAPTIDPQSKLQLNVPSFAGFVFDLDIGRCVTPSMFILAHNLLASLRTNSEPETILRIFYSTKILTIHETHYTPSDFIGGYFDHAQRPTSHINWLNTRFEKIFNPV